MTDRDGMYVFTLIITSKELTHFPYIEMSLIVDLSKIRAEEINHSQFANLIRSYCFFDAGYVFHSHTMYGKTKKSIKSLQMSQTALARITLMNLLQFTLVLLNIVRPLTSAEIFIYKFYSCTTIFT